MIAVILAGGFGFRFNETTEKLPKPLVTVAKTPLILYTMNNYSFYGVNNFIICAGFKKKKIFDFFSNPKNFSKLTKIKKISKSQFEIYFSKGKIWKIRIVDTGLKTETGGRLLKIKKFLKSEDYFMTSYGDIISNINISKQIKFFLKKKLVAVISAVSVPSRFGILKMDNNKLVKSFDEKPNIKSQKINGGFFVFSHKIFTYIKNEKNSLEGIPMTLLSKQRQLAAYMHSDFWQPIDNMKDKLSVEKIIKKINFYKNVK